MEDFGLKLSSSSTRDTARFTLDPSLCADKPIVLIVKHAGRGNEPFMAAAFKQASTRQPVAGPSLAADQASREEDAELFAKHVIVGWENVPGAYDARRGQDFLGVLIQPRQGGEKDADYGFRLAEFDRLRIFCRNTANFRDPAGSAEDLGKG